MFSGFGQERKLSEYVHHYEPLTYDASGVHGQHHRHKRSLPEEDHKVSFYQITKGQKISKQNCHAETSSKKTNEQIWFSILKSSYILGI